MKILFICTHNRCRSILGEAITRSIVSNNFHIQSAGAHPVDSVHPDTIRYLNEMNIDTQGLNSKSWDELESFNPNVVITVCDSAANESCPMWMGDSIKVHWGLQDPSKIIDDNERKVQFLKTMSILNHRAEALSKTDFSNKNQEQIRMIFTKIGEIM